MSTSGVVPRSVSESRPAFDLFEGFATSNVLAGLEMAGLLGTLEERGLSEEDARRRDPDEAALLLASLRYLRDRALVQESSGRFTLTDFGREVCEDKGYIVWLVGGYGEPLRRLDALLAMGSRYGTDYVRDGRWVADGTTLMARKDVIPHTLRLLDKLEFDSVVDIGCGNARLLLTICQRAGARGVGVDINPEACALAEEAVREAGMTDRVQILCGNALDLDAIPGLAETQLVITFVLLHEILGKGHDALVGYLSDLAARLPVGAYLVIKEVEPPSGEGTGAEVFTPEFTLVHALMRQSLLTADGWRAAVEEAGFSVREVIADDMPGGIQLVCQKPRQ